jgi:uncharacterized membrane protein
MTKLLYATVLTGFAFYIMYVVSFTDKSIDENTKRKKANKAGIVLSAMIGPLIFGFLDNFGMMIGTDAIEDLVEDTPVVKSMLGNTFSDGLGALIGSSISSMMRSTTAYDERQIAHWLRPLLELLGIVIGCLIPIAFVKSKKKNVYKIIAVGFVMFFVSLLTYMISNHFTEKTPDIFKVSEEK